MNDIGEVVVGGYVNNTADFDPGPGTFIVDSSGGTGGFVWSLNQNTAPTIGDVADQNVDEDDTLGPLTFTVDDNETDPATLTVTAVSSNWGSERRRGAGFPGRRSTRRVLRS